MGAVPGRGGWAGVAALALAGMTLAAWLRPGGPKRPPPRLPAEDKDVAALVSRLLSRGLKVRVVSTRHPGSPEDSDVCDNTYLTSTGKGWDELNRLTRLREYIARWRGTVYCERVHDPFLPVSRDQEEEWGDCCLLAGPFVFFGDPELLARIRDLLLAPEQP